MVFALPSIGSDHCPLVLDTHYQTSKLQAVSHKLSSWSRARFTNARQQIQCLQQQLQTFNWEHRKLLVQMASLVCFTGTKGIQFNRACPQLSHLLFADDAVFFLKASISECQNFSDLWCEDMVSTWAFHQIGGDLNGRCFLGSSVCNVSIYAPPFSLNPEIGCLVGDPCNPLSFFPQL